MRKRLLLLMIVAGSAGTAQGDGKFFVREKIPAAIPYQRAILLFHESQETLILQSKYDLPQSQPVDSLAWIVPTPAIPEIAGGNTDAAMDCFRMASWHTQPHVRRISNELSPAFFMLCLGGFAFMLICLLQYPRARRKESSKIVWGRRARNAAIVTVVAFLLAIVFMPPLARGIDGVDVVKAQKAGVYDVKVIFSQNAEAVMEWLKENRFGFSDEDRQVFQDYVARGWCFVAAKVDPARGTEEKRIVSEGMAAPLLLKFASERPVYPLALTATAGMETEVLIYTLSDAKLTCAERLALQRARQMEIQPILRSLVAQAEVEEWSLLRDLPETPMMLCKFKGRLTPAQMKQDLEFAPAPDNEPYQERRIVW
jgi:hypothetical protein